MSGVYNNGNVKSIALLCVFNRIGIYLPIPIAYFKLIKHLSYPVGEDWRPFDVDRLWSRPRGRN